MDEIKNTENGSEWLLDLKEMNKELEEKILAANKDSTKVKWNRLLPELMGADVLMIGQFTEETGDDGQKRLNILMMQKDGHTVVPFFTNPERIAALSKNATDTLDVMKINTVRFFQSVPDKYTVLDPMTEYVHVFSPFDMRVLAAENIDKAPIIPEKSE